tara:strand:- start:420 stop:854 length:435 start_codon:yes stop_codon:yes gene_type:complete
LTFYNNSDSITVLKVREKKEKNMRETEFDLNTPEGLNAALKQRKIDLHNDAKSTAEIFRKHNLFVRVVFRKHYDSYVRIYGSACKQVHGDPKWIDIANTAMQEAIAMGYQNDVFFAHGGECSTGIGNSLRWRNCQSGSYAELQK